ncbi:MAG: hypothetical protein ACK4L4_10060 [Gemmobacter sp.]
MYHSFKVAAAALLVSAPAAMAQQVTGGSLSLSHSFLTDESSISKTTLLGAVEVGLNRDFSLQFDLGLNRLNEVKENTTNFVLHGIYHLNENTSAGLFAGTDRADGESVNFIGFEFGHVAGQTGFEAYAARGEEQGISGTILGLSTRYAATPQFGIGVSVDQLDIGVANARRYSVNGDYDVVPNFKVFGELGVVRGSVPLAELSGSEGYVKLGGKITFGAKRGTTFGQRSLTNLLPGG